MKVKLEENYRRNYTLEDFDRAKKVIAFEKDDPDTASGWAVYAVNEVQEQFGWCDEVLRATASTYKNVDAWNAYGDGSGNMDIWIEGIAKTTKGYLEFGAYLSDIWEAGITPFGHRMYTRFYAPKE